MVVELPEVHCWSQSLTLDRDGYLVTIPSLVQHRLEILHEARYYRLDSLASIIASPAQYQQPHPYVTQQMAAQALAANAAAQMAAQAQAQAQSRLQPDQEKPSFLTVRPSTRGLFYLCDAKWSSIFPEKPAWNVIAVNFEDASDEVINYKVFSSHTGGILVYCCGFWSRCLRTHCAFSLKQTGTISHEVGRRNEREGNLTIYYFLTRKDYYRPFPLGNRSFRRTPDS